LTIAAVLAAVRRQFPFKETKETGSKQEAIQNAKYLELP
jgi:hypothetical protein